jgi:hypothetical protein
MENPPLASLSLTHVHYVCIPQAHKQEQLLILQNPADRISYLCAWLALVPQGLCVIYATLIWSNREIEIFLMFAGQMACEALNWVLKRYIKEERPRGTSQVIAQPKPNILMPSRNAWKRLRHAFLSRAIRVFFFRYIDTVFTLSTHSASHGYTHAV